MTQPPLIWSVTASDSSGGAGSAADLRVAQAMEVDCAVITLAITAQNSAGVQALTLVDTPMLEAQWQSLEQDGWDVQYLGYIEEDGYTLPSRIKLAGRDLKITLVVKDWQPRQLGH